MTDELISNGKDSPQQLAEMRQLSRVLLASGCIAILVRFAIIAGGAGGYAKLLDPFMLGVTVWVIAPTVAVSWWVAKSAFGLVGFFPIAIIGNLLAYNIANDTSSSTAAISWLILPAYEWAYVAASIAAVWLLKKFI